MQQWQWFDYSDFACKCGCNCNKINPELITMLNEARIHAMVSFTINSGYRCEKHNKAIGSTSDNHPSGEAADIRCTTGPVRIKIIAGLISAGFRRIGFHSTFIHADRMDRAFGRVQSFWDY